jgi:TRAP-type transport system small permease protein
MAFVCRMLRVSVGALIAALVITVAMGVFYRYALKSSLYWATEVPNFILVWIVFLGSVVAFYDNKHIAFTLVGKSIGGRTEILFEIVSTLIVLTVLVVLTWFGILLVGSTMKSASEALKIPQGYLYSCIPIASTLMILIAVEHLVGAARRLSGAAS